MLADKIKIAFDNTQNNITEQYYERIIEHIQMCITHFTPPFEYTLNVDISDTSRDKLVSKLLNDGFDVEAVHCYEKVYKLKISFKNPNAASSILPLKILLLAATTALPFVLFVLYKMNKII